MITTLRDYFIAFFTEFLFLKIQAQFFSYLKKHRIIEIIFNRQQKNLFFKIIFKKYNHAPGRRNSENSRINFIILMKSIL